MNWKRRTVLAAAAGLMLPATGRASATRYQYDALGRVIGVLHANGAATTYSYDAAGNRTSKESAQHITSEGLDPDFYLITYPDIYNAGTDPYSHYMNTGWHENRDPSAYFSTSGYLNAYPDILAAGVNPLTHYDVYGWHEGRNPSTLFNTRLYLQNNPDVAAGGDNPYHHYIRYGIYEGRLPCGTGSF